MLPDSMLNETSAAYIIHKSLVPYVNTGVGNVKFFPHTLHAKSVFCVNSNMFTIPYLCIKHDACLTQMREAYFLCESKHASPSNQPTNQPSEANSYAASQEIP
jgi:hypothetical protein